MRLGRRALVLGTLLLMLPLGWIPAALAAPHAPCSAEHVGALDTHGACPQHECCLGTADVPAPRANGTPIAVVVTRVPSITASHSLRHDLETRPSVPPISRTLAAGLPLLC